MMPTTGISIEAAHQQLTREFRRLGVDSPGLDARLIVRHALGLDQAGLAAQARRMLTVEERAAIAALAARRVAREPVARILGGKEFWSLWFKVNAETLLPRPESEIVVEAALAAMDTERRKSQNLRIADLGTGSGALLLALLSELPNAHGVGTDINLTVLDCARDNAAALDMSARSAFVACDYGTALQARFDLVISNPPYVAHGEIAALQPEVRDFDPRRALDGGPDGLEAYRAIAADALRLLAADARLVVELGRGQLDSVTAIFGKAGLAPAAVRYDLSGVARALVVRRP
jgi:release factor glutamine methyltransferase